MVMVLFSPSERKRPARNTWGQRERLKKGKRELG